MLKTLVRLIAVGSAYLAMSQMAAAGVCDKPIQVNGNYNTIQQICIVYGSQTTKPPSLWDHNGSVVRLTAKGAERQFFYEVPRTGLRPMGVTQGTVLFSGISQGGYYKGTAFVFRTGCAPSPYLVSGPIDDDNRGVTVYGDAPLLNSACEVVGFRHDTLIFSFLGT